jgi:hypothetical protein
MTRTDATTATADFSGWCWRMHLWCSLHLSSTVLPLCPRYIFPHTRGIRYKPGTLKFYSVLSRPQHVCGFPFLGCEPFRYYVASEVYWWLLIGAVYLLTQDKYKPHCVSCDINYMFHSPKINVKSSPHYFATILPQEWKNKFTTWGYFCLQNDTSHRNCFTRYNT